MQFRAPTQGYIHCYICHALNVEGCQTCRRCKSCGCQCQICSCGDSHPRKVQWLCRVCGHCKRICTCRKRPLVLRNGFFPKKVGFKKNPLRRALGLEIELNPAKYDIDSDARPAWLNYQWVRDGSLQKGGQEMVVHPLLGDTLVEGVKWLAKKFAKYNCGVDDFCGLHVHVDMKEEGVLELRRLVQLYSAVEAEIFTKFVHPSRIASRFCKPWKVFLAERGAEQAEWFKKLWSLSQPREVKAYLLETLYPRTSQKQWVSKKEFKRQFLSLPTKREHKYEQARYAGLNLHTWFQRGTVEFRHHEGTVDGEEITQWALLCGWVVELACVLRDAEIQEIGGLAEMVGGVWKHEFGPAIMVDAGVREWVLGVI